MDKFLYYIGIPVLINVIPQLLLNSVFLFFLNEKHLKAYKVISYIVITLLVIWVPIWGVVKTLYLLSVTGTPDPAGIAFDGYIFVYWGVNAIVMFLIQVFFNQVYLPKRLL